MQSNDPVLAREQQLMMSQVEERLIACLGQICQYSLKDIVAEKHPAGERHGRQPHQLNGR